MKQVVNPPFDNLSHPLQATVRSPLGPTLRVVPRSFVRLRSWPQGEEEKIGWPIRARSAFRTRLDCAFRGWNASRGCYRCSKANSPLLVEGHKRTGEACPMSETDTYRSSKINLSFTSPHYGLNPSYPAVTETEDSPDFPTLLSCVRRTSPERQGRVCLIGDETITCRGNEK